MDHLVEPGIRDYFHNSFEECKQFKMVYYTRVLNIVLFILFVGIVSTVLYFKKKKKLTPAQKNKKNEEDRMYIINKIRSLQIKNNSYNI